MQGSVSNSNNSQNDKFFDFSFGKDKIFSKYIPSAIFFLFALFAFLACAFALHKVNLTPLAKQTLDYYGIEIHTSENGFYFLDSDSVAISYGWANTLLRLFSWFTFLAGLFALVVSVLTFFVASEKFVKNIRLTCIIICLSLLFCYMVGGIVLVSIEQKEGLFLVGYYDYVDKSYYKSITTSAFVPFMLCSIFSIAYFIYPMIARKKISDEMAFVAPATDGTVRQSASSPKTYKSTMDKIALLKQYKELLDSGIITEEEFNEKKKGLID